MQQVATIQEKLLPLLEGFKYRQYWIVNAIAVFNGTKALVDTLSKNELIELISPNKNIPQEIPKSNSFGTPKQVEWHIEWINATALWAKGIKGKGIVVAGADTGIAWDHPGLRTHYRGARDDGNLITHDYHWYDAIRSDEFPNCKQTPCGCGDDKNSASCDDDGHGNDCILRIDIL